MRQLSDKIQNASDESRMLILGAEILFAFEFTAVFQERFRHLSIASQNLNLGARVLCLLP
jgi:hypothetical protein